MPVKVIKGRGLVNGKGHGEILFSPEPISFYGGVDPLTGIIVEKGHSLYGKSVKDKILIFPHGKGSTVGSYILLRLKRKGLAPSGIVNLETEPIILIGCMIASIPLMDKPEDLLSKNINGKKAEIFVKKDLAFLRVMYE
ncbi:MAG: hypothetical protein DRJ41_04025 [Thermoprotei archaeon]|nr:MAG: hypothetical protein DRJ41_04025 [Thermoprotei archaeon]